MDKKVEQALPDIPFALKEMQSIKTVFQQYIKDERDFYHLQAPSMAQIDETVEHIKLRLKHNPETNYCLIIAAIGEGIQREGSENLVINEWDSNSRYFKLWKVQ